MDPENSEAYEAVVLTCFACAKREAQSRQAGEDSRSGKYGAAAFDGLKIGVTEKGAM